ncbi:hypothetical protein B0T24DRAFT_708858 [Lasiosphaeria ovina]|uniref:Uncharacterized protein n=1 Tax=Lasiosphaeria ovina TaxID=92902 RepID=A0AAE0N0Y8_9PEZI|nr:hypothetical protein B0T24DRAFT_708858 [Lasiosphaeria ovina]
MAAPVDQPVSVHALKRLQSRDSGDNRSEGFKIRLILAPDVSPSYTPDLAKSPWQWLANLALARLTERYFDPAAQRVSGQLAHVIFIGCPHPTTANAEQWPLLGHVLRSDPEADNKAVKTATEVTGIVSSLCVKFHESGIQCPVLTTYETRPTKIRLSALRSEKRLPIPREFAETGIRGEELVPLNLDPRGIKSVGASTQHAKEFRQKVKLLLSGPRELSVARAAQNAINIPVINQNLFASTATQTAPSQPGDVLSTDPAGATFASTERAFSVGWNLVPYEAHNPVNIFLPTAKANTENLGQDPTTTSWPVFKRILGVVHHHPNIATPRMRILQGEQGSLLYGHASKTTSAGSDILITVIGVTGAGKTSFITLVSW